MSAPDTKTLAERLAESRLLHNRLSRIGSSHNDCGRPDCDDFGCVTARDENQTIAEAVAALRAQQEQSEPALFVLKYEGKPFCQTNFVFDSEEAAWAYVKDPAHNLYRSWKEHESLDDWEVVALFTHPSEPVFTREDVEACRDVFNNCGREVFFRDLADRIARSLSTSPETTDNG